MKTKTLFKGIILMSAMLLLNIIHAQTTINGTVVDEETNQPLPGVNIVVKGTYTGVSADFDGNFTITTEEEFPITLEVSYLGFATKSIEVTSADAAMNISLAPGSDSLDEIVVAASRFAQRIFESPITVENSVLSKFSRPLQPISLMA